MEYVAGVPLYPQGNAPAVKADVGSGSSTALYRQVARPVSTQKHPNYYPDRVPSCAGAAMRDYSWSDNALAAQSKPHAPGVIVYSYQITGHPDNRVCHIGATVRFSGNSLYRLFNKGSYGVSRHVFGTALRFTMRAVESITLLQAWDLIQRFQQPGVQVLELWYQEHNEPGTTLHLEWVNRPPADAPLEELVKPEPVTPIPDRRRKRGRYYDSSEPEEEEGNPQFY